MKIKPIRNQSFCEIFILYVFLLISCGISAQVDMSRPLSVGNLAYLLDDVNDKQNLQLERLAAYFFHQRINQYRLENKLTTLYWDDRMWLAARNHNLYQWKLNNITHDEVKGRLFFTGSKAWDRIQYVMYGSFKIESYSENVLYFTSNYNLLLVDYAKEISNKSFEIWRNSPGHNTNMLMVSHFAHGTSFIVVDDKVYGTTNFGNASDFALSEIRISWNDSLAKLYPPLAEERRKPFIPSVWSVHTSEQELHNLLKANMPKSKTAYSGDLEMTALTNKRNRVQDVETETIIKEHTKFRYIKTAKRLKIKFLFNKLYEKYYRFSFTQKQLSNRSALGIIDEQLKRDLPITSIIENWGGKCTLVPKDSLFVCDINLIYMNRRK